MKSELQKLISLQELDVKIKKIETEIADIPKQKAKIEDQFNTFAADYLDKKSRLDAINKEDRQLELEIKELEQKQEKYKQDLMRVRNEREYSTALREIDETKKTISVLETQTLQTLETIEQLEKEIKKLTPEIEVKRKEFDLLIEECSTKIEKLDVDLEALHAQRSKLMETIVSDVLEQYNRLRNHRDSIALAEVRDGSCAACFMTVRPQVYADVRQGRQILTCENCGRILYYKKNLKVQESKSAG